jgi:hypothetical protein
MILDHEDTQMIELPTELTVEQSEVTWLNINGPIDVIGKLSQWMYENQCSPIWNCGGSAGPWFIKMAFEPHKANLVIAKIKELQDQNHVVPKS